MFLNDVISALTNDPSGTLRSILRIFHFFGLAIGLGTATVMDLMIVRFFLGKVITAEMCDVFSFCSKIVLAGLLCLWITGVGFLVYYSVFAPNGLTNEKVLAKIVIVTILSINGVYIHTSVLPLIENQVGRYLFEDMPLWRCRCLFASAVVSSVSWFGPLVIAGIGQLNFSVPAGQILAVYAIVLTIALFLSQVVLSIAEKSAR